MVFSYEKAFQEFNPDQVGGRNPASVFVVNHIKDVVGMRGEMEEGLRG